MDIRHRTVFSRKDAVEGELDRLGIQYYRTEGLGEAYIISLQVSESHSAWSRIAELVEQKRAPDFYDTFFTVPEILHAEWSRLIPTLERGYPQPESGWKVTTYEGQCPKCGIGHRQKAPFHLAAEPRMGRNHFLGLYWTWTVFCVTEVVEAIKAEGFAGFDVWPAIIHKTGESSKVVSQLLFPNMAGPALAEEDKQQPETCPLCGVTKYLYHKRGYMHLKRDALVPGVDFQQTCEWFGSGGFSGFMEILISQRVARLILGKGWRGVRLKPVELV